MDGVSQVSALVVDDDAATRRLVKRVLRGIGCQVAEAEDGVDAIAHLGRSRFDVVITDLRMPRVGGMEVLEAVRQKHPGTPSIMLTAHGAMAECVAAMRAGAMDFLTKPFHVNDLESVLRRALQHGKPGEHGHEPTRPQAQLIGRSPALQALLAMVERVARSEATVLVTGETGTGKEVLARLIHGMSARAGGPLIAINCGAIPEGLVESELFGHAKGAFTGATERRAGKFAMADGGTIFLDEIGELSPAVQVKLLRVLQERQVTPVGDTASVPIDVRVIAATHRDLEVMTRAGSFRQDLFFRLDVVRLDMPPLRARRDDVVLLARHFLEGACARAGRHLELSRAAIERLTAYDWPGNVRELENVIERMVILARGDEIGEADLPAKVRGAAEVAPEVALPPPSADAVSLPAEGIDLQQALGQLEQRLIDEALERSGGNKTAAARLLGLNRTTLIEKLRRRGVS
jgi:DNA-binding NtrC family response regulator